MLKLFVNLLLFALPVTSVAEPKDLVAQIIDKISYCESRNNPLAWNDNDGREGEHSMGILQMKMKTIQWASQRYKIQMEDPLNPDFQKKLARAIIEDGRGQTHWVNCWKRI